jgi:hypothetical protein
MSISEGQYRYGGMYGSAWRDGRMLAEVVTVDAPVEMNRVTMPLVGSTREGHKRGREGREGSLTIQKIDAYWEMQMKRAMSASLQQRRRQRDLGQGGTGLTAPFELHLVHDDPDALGKEEWVLQGCQIWRLPLGINITDDVVQREFPLTWEDEYPLYAFEAKAGSPHPTVSWYTSATVPGLLGRPPATELGTPVRRW